MNRCRLLDVAFSVHVRLKVNAGMDFISVILAEIKFHCVIKYHVHTTRNEMATHAHQNIELF